ncbi:hypothetical protein T07_10461 [Trichinella nelsoni]|uniref:Uncharacterized protein n=1 Tax=Trichinella nelsoni TaxID=6336 RepID=A0A0V0SJN6_9BILA|nr:hypothetical protein T07_10461 [Trichinella nelsoni]
MHVQLNKEAFASKLLTSERHQEVPMHKNRFLTLLYANNDRHTRCLIVDMNNEERSENVVDTKESADGTKQNKRREKNGLGILRKGEVIPMLEFVFSKKFQCTKTGFYRCSMQIMIAIKRALSSVRKISENAVDTKRNADGTKKEKVKTRVTRRADRGRHEAEQEKTKGICGSPWVPILYVWARDTSKG